jgi:hypothetical protein
MAIEFFTENFKTDGYNSSLSSSFQGQLASSYTNQITDVLQANADWLGFLAWDVNDLSVAAALEVKALVAAGDFTLSGLFGAAQSKTGEVPGADVPNPQPILQVTLADFTVVTLDLTAILSDLDTETWTQLETTGGGKKGTITTQVFHTREFYTDADKPAGYFEGWENEGGGPTTHEGSTTFSQPIGLTPSSPNSGTFSIVLDDEGFDFSGTGTITVTGDIDRGIEVAKVTLENGTVTDFTQGDAGKNLEPANDYSHEGTPSVTITGISFNSTNNTIDVTWSASQPVGEIVLISGALDYTYWA